MAKFPADLIAEVAYEALRGAYGNDNFVPWGEVPQALRGEIALAVLERLVNPDSMPPSLLKQYPAGATGLRIFVNVVDAFRHIGERGGDPPKQKLPFPTAGPHG